MEPQPSNDQDRVCDNCGRWIEKVETLYEMTVVLRAEPGPIHELPDAQDDLLAELQALVERMERMNEEQVSEAVDQVHESYRFILCPSCRGEAHTRLKRRRNVVGD